MTVSGVYRKGKVTLDSPVNWRDGDRVTVQPEEQSLGLNEADWPNTPEARAELLRRFEELQPLEFTEEERDELAAARAEVREVTLKEVRKKSLLEVIGSIRQGQEAREHKPRTRNEIDAELADERSSWES